MAIAGKVAITLSKENDGKWSADVTYDRLVAVTHNNNLYISRTQSTGIEPTNDTYWFLALQGFGGDDVQALINQINDLGNALQEIIFGTQQVGNAKKLDGHGAEYFTSVYGYPLNSFYGNSEAEIDQFLNKLHAEATNRYFYTAELSFGVNHSQLGSSNKLIVGSRTNAEYGWQMAITYGNSVDRIRYRQMQGGTWSNWDSGAFVSDLANYLSKTSNRVGDIGFDNANYLNVTIDGSIFHIPISSKPSSTNIFNGTATGNLPLTGGAIRGGLDIIMATPYVDFTSDNTKDYTIRVIEGSKGVLDIINGDNNGKRLRIDTNSLTGVNTPLHTGNKPTGTYTGDGTSNRYINTGGTGNVIAIKSEKGMTLCIGGFGTAVKADGSTVGTINISFSNGELRIATASDVINASGVTYTYQVL